MATIKDVAKRAHVSVATVSRVLNGSAKVSEQTRKAVLAAQQELSFYLNANAKALAQQDSHIIGATVPDMADPYFGTMIRACERAAQPLGCTLMAIQGFHDAKREEQAIVSLISHQCRGLIIHALSMKEEVLADYMERIPYLVVINRTIKGFEGRCINIDNVKGEYLAVKELIAQGHRKIAYIGSSHKIPDSAERLQGYKRALQEAGIKFDPNLMVAYEPYLEGGTQAALDLLKRKVKFTAVACYNDFMAAGAMSVLSEAGFKIPDDISVAGFDDLFLASCLIPKLTTVHHPVEEMARGAVLLSSALYAHEEPEPLPEFEVSLVKRKSVSPVHGRSRIKD